MIREGREHLTIRLAEARELAQPVDDRHQPDDVARLGHRRHDRVVRSELVRES